MPRLSPAIFSVLTAAKAPVDTTEGTCSAGSIEQAQDALILFDVAAIFAVVTRNTDCSPHRGFLTPDTGAGDCGARGELACAAHLSELDAHAVERTVKLGDVARAAVVGGDCK